MLSDVLTHFIYYHYILVLVQILARGCFLSKIQARGVDAKKWGLKTHLMHSSPRS
jgi:hypothetical protein